MKITSIFSPESNDLERSKRPERLPKRPLSDIASRLLVVFVVFFALSFLGTHFIGSKYHPGDTMATGPSIVVATIVALVMTIYLAKYV